MITCFSVIINGIYTNIVMFNDCASLIEPSEFNFGLHLSGLVGNSELHDGDQMTGKNQQSFRTVLRYR